MSAAQKAKLCYVLPFYDPATATHYAHLYELLESASHELDIYLIVGRAATDARPGIFAHAHVLGESGRLGMALGYLRAIVGARVRGYRTFYVHYHVGASIAAVLLAYVAGARLLIWRCIRSRRYFAPWSLKPALLRRKLFVDWPTLILFKTVHRLVTCSEFMAQYYAEEFGLPDRRLRVLENWIDPARFRLADVSQGEARRRLGLPPDGPVVLYVHTLSEHRGAHLIPPIARRVLNEVPGVLFLIVGDGPYLNQLRQEAAEQGLTDVVRCIGSVPNREVPLCFRAADLFINPTLDEAFGRVLLEAMAAGVPFVSTDGGGGVLAFVGPRQRRYVVPTDDVSAFARAAVEVLQNADTAAQLVEEGTSIAEAHSLEAATKRFVELVTEG